MKKKEAFKRELQPKKKDIELAELCKDSVACNILIKEIKAGSVIILLGGEFSPIEDYRRAMRLEMRKPTDNGVCMYDAYVPFTSPAMRPIVTVSLFDNGNETIVHSIKRLGSIRSKTIYASC